MRRTVLALDLERTLIDDAFHGRPRPGLATFLAFCEARAPRIVIFTTVEESDARAVLTDLQTQGQVSGTLLARLEYIAWTGEFKDLTFIPQARVDEVVLVDDDAGWVRPDQRGQWLPIRPWDGGPDSELGRIRTILEELFPSEL